MPRPSSRTPSTGDRVDGARSPRRPASTATTSSREAIQAGTTAASTALSSPNPATPTSTSQGTSYCPKTEPEKRWRTGIARAPTPRPATTPSTEATEPRTTPVASTRRRAWAGVPPEATISAIERDWRRALTAKAGPASSTTSSRAITTTSTTTESVPSSSPLGRARTSAGSSESGGGSVITAREVTSAPISLRDWTSDQVTEPPPTRTVRPYDASAGPKAPGIPTASGWSRTASDSTVPTIARLSSSVTRRSPTAGPRSARAALTTTSPGASGSRPEVSSKRPAASGSRRSTSVASPVPTPLSVVNRSSRTTRSTAGTSRPSTRSIAARSTISAFGS